MTQQDPEKKRSWSEVLAALEEVDVPDDFLEDRNQPEPQDRDWDAIAE